MHLETGGSLRFYSGCALKSVCTAQEKQNFAGSVPMMHQCASTFTLENSRRRFMRGVKCSFCHKMGSAATTIFGGESPTIPSTTFTAQERSVDNMQTRLAAWAATQDVAPWYTSETASIF